MSADRAPNFSPLWWRLPLWGLLVAYSVYHGSGFGTRLAGGLTLGAAAIAIQFVNAEDRTIRQASVLITGLGGVAACLLMPNGAAEVAMFLAAARAPTAFEGRALNWFVVLGTITTGAVIAVISSNVASLLAGAGVPVLTQRAVEHRELVRERDRAQALLAEAQRARESESENAALQERGRIAREMHDVLAHSLAGLSMQLQGVRALAAREKVPAPLLGELDKAADLARSGLAEARSAVSALRDPIGLGLAELPALIDRHPGVATLTDTGSPLAVAPAAGHAVYRAVQESLTNAARYAPGSPVMVTLAWSADTLIVTVADSGPAPGRSAVAGQGTGLGLAGMAERVSEVDGTAQAGPRAEGGWMTTITVPAR